MLTDQAFLHESISTVAWTVFLPQFCRLASKAGQDDSLDWLHQASGLALTQAGQRALLQAGLPQELLHQLQQLPMQLLDSDSEASREQKRARALYKCQARQHGFTWKVVHTLLAANGLRHKDYREKSNACIAYTGMPCLSNSYFKPLKFLGPFPF